MNKKARAAGRSGITVAVLLFGLAAWPQKSGLPQAAKTSAESAPVYVCSAEHPPSKGPCAKTPPRAIFTPDPEYSEEAREAHYHGTVLLTVVVDEMGRVEDVTVTRAAGKGLDEQAMAAVRQWKFKPGLLADGTPIAVQVKVEVSFRMQ